MQPPSAASSMASTWALLRISRMPALTGTATGMWCTCRVPALCSGMASPVMRVSVMPSWLARARSTSASPSTDSRHGNDCLDSAMQRSGPTPAGSPAVSAMTGNSGGMLESVDRAQFDVGLIANLPYPVLERLFSLAFADRLARQQALAFLRHVLVAAFQHLNQMQAEG